MLSLPQAPHGWQLVSLHHERERERLAAIVAEQLVVGPAEVLSVLGHTLPPSVPLAVAPSSRIFEIVFTAPVVYRVLPENCSPPDPHGEPSGNPMQYERSLFMDQMAQSTVVMELHGPGIRHYCLVTDSFVIDVLCRGPHIITERPSAGA